MIAPARSGRSGCIKTHQRVPPHDRQPAKDLCPFPASVDGASKGTWKARGRGGGKSAFWGVAGGHPRPGPRMPGLGAMGAPCCPRQRPPTGDRLRNNVSPRL